MRPPRIAAEYLRPNFRHGGGRWCFNEAAANRGGIHRERGSGCNPVNRFNEAAANRGGIPHTLTPLLSATARFNEAAANRGGILRQSYGSASYSRASMRPPRIAAEYGVTHRQDH